MPCTNPNPKQCERCTCGAVAPYTAAEVVAIAKRYAPYASMASSALLCIDDAEALLARASACAAPPTGKPPKVCESFETLQRSAKDRAVKSLRYSLGITSEVYKRAAAC